MYDCMVTPIELKRVFSPRGVPAFEGRFAFAKKGEVPAGVERITRLITNVGTNCCLETLGAEVATLQGTAGWAAIHIGQGQFRLWSGDDVKGPFTCSLC